MTIYVMILCLSIQKKTRETKRLNNPRSLFLSRRQTILSLTFTMAFLFFSLPFISHADFGSRYCAVPGLIDLRTAFSDGAHSMEELVKMARQRGFRVVFMNDHDRIALSYGVPPFRKIFRYKKEFPSIMTHRPEQYLAEVRRLSKEYPDMVIIPGCITSPFYYWTGSWFKKNLTLHDYDRRILIVNLTNPEDYNGIPTIGSGSSLRYTASLLPGWIIFWVPFFIGFVLFKWKGFSRFMGVFLVVIACLALIDYHPFRNWHFTPYAGNQGIEPYQEVIDYAKERGALVFWNYPEQRSGVRKHGPIFVETPPHPEVLRESKRYTGFAAIYGDNITCTEPGKEWDWVLNAYCRGERKRPPWGISTADFHEDGRLGLKLGAFATTFLVSEFSAKGILDALENGRMYCSRGNGEVWPKLDTFLVTGEGHERAIMGETLTTSRYPRIRFRISVGSKEPMRVMLIRGGTVIATFNGEARIDADYVDREIPPDITTYYRIMDTRKHLTSNPIFVKYERL
jgi:hypothetical protein